MFLNKVKQLDYPRDLSKQRPKTFHIMSIIVIETYALGIDRNLKLNVYDKLRCFCVELLEVNQNSKVSPFY